jgi:hypothetical protein
MAPVRYLDTDKDDGGVIPGVPKRDLEQDEYDALPAHLRADVDASYLYRKTKPAAAHAPDKAKDGN